MASDNSFLGQCLVISPDDKLHHLMKPREKHLPFQHKLTMGDKTVETLGSNKFDFRGSWSNFAPFFPKQC